MGGFCSLSGWLYGLYCADVAPTYDEARESVCRLSENGLVSRFAFGYRITSRGGAVLRGERVEAPKRMRKASSFSEADFERAKADALTKWKLQRDGKSGALRRANALGVLLWLLSLACLAGGIAFACLYRGSVGWRVGVCVAGVVLYVVLGTVDELFCASRCSGRVENFLTVACFPSYGLLALILMGG